MPPVTLMHRRLGNNNTVLASVERYDSVLDTWTNMASLPVGTYHFGAVFDGTNTIYAFGGRTNVTAGTETAAVLSYNVSANTWSTLASMPVATAGSTAIKDRREILCHRRHGGRGRDEFGPGL